MNLKHFSSVALLAAVMVLPISVQAADTDKAVESKAPVADAQPEKESAKKKTKPHSHVEEKTGIPQKYPEGKSDKVDASKDKSKHYHPRDMK